MFVEFTAYGKNGRIYQNTGVYHSPPTKKELSKDAEHFANTMEKANNTNIYTFSYTIDEPVIITREKSNYELEMQYQTLTIKIPIRNDTKIWAGTEIFIDNVKMKDVKMIDVHVEVGNPVVLKIERII